MTDYISSYDFWPDSPVIEVRNSDGEAIAMIPLHFVSTGHDNTWRFVTDLVDIITGETPVNPPRVRIASSGTLLNLDDAPTGGVIVYSASTTLGRSFRVMLMVSLAGSTSNTDLSGQDDA